MKPTITAFENSPDKGQGLARDMLVRWALEEVNQDYDVRLISFKELKDTPHRKIHPFGKIPTYEVGDLALFETGGIILHIAETHSGLLPKDADLRSRAIMWMFCAMSTMEPTIVERNSAALFETDKSWQKDRQPMLDERVVVRLNELSNYLGKSEWLDGDFSAGDLMMISVLRRLRNTDFVSKIPNLKDYVARGEARSAFKKAFAAQLAVYEKAQAK